MSESQIKVHVKLFAAFQETIAQSELDVFLPLNSPVQNIYDQLENQYPDIKKWRSLTRYAINLDFVDSNTVLQDGDEVALIPPVSGG